MTEGSVTEPQYVERLHQTLRGTGVAVSVKAVGTGRDPAAVVRKGAELRDWALKQRKAYDRCVCLVDVDTHATLSTAVALAKREGIDLVVSNLKFEVWLLWHVTDVRGSRSSRELDELMAKHGLLRGKHLAPSFPVDQVQRAEATAARVHPELSIGDVGEDPSSTMPHLVELLRHGIRDTARQDRDSGR